MLIPTSAQTLQRYIDALKAGGTQGLYKRTVPAAIAGLQSEDSEIRALAMELLGELFAHGLAFNEAAKLINSGKIKETFEHERLTTGITQIFHQYGKEDMLR
jgi:hypothetical protein